jgi:hypothetical protein
MRKFEQTCQTIGAVGTDRQPRLTLFLDTQMIDDTLVEFFAMLMLPFFWGVFFLKERTVLQPEANATLCGDCVGDLLAFYPFHQSIQPSTPCAIEFAAQTPPLRQLSHPFIHFGFGPPSEGKSSVSFTLRDFA